MSTWNKRITLAREKKGLRKSAFAKLVKVSAPTVTDWESGETKKIDGENLTNVCNVLGITADWLLFGKTAQAAPAQDGEFARNLDYFTDEEKEIITAFRETTAQGKMAIKDMANSVPRTRLKIAHSN